MNWTFTWQYFVCEWVLLHLWNFLVFHSKVFRIKIVSFVLGRSPPPMRRGRSPPRRSPPRRRTRSPAPRRPIRSRSRSRSAPRRYIHGSINFTKLWMHSSCTYCCGSTSEVCTLTGSSILCNWKVPMQLMTPACKSCVLWLTACSGCQARGLTKTNVVVMQGTISSREASKVNLLFVIT